MKRKLFEDAIESEEARRKLCRELIRRGYGRLAYREHGEDFIVTEESLYIWIESPVKLELLLEEGVKLEVVSGGLFFFRRGEEFLVLCRSIYGYLSVPYWAHKEFRPISEGLEWGNKVQNDPYRDRCRKALNILKARMMEDCRVS